MLTKNSDIELYIDGMTADGSGVGHYDGQAVFVRNTAIGDSVNVHIIKAKKTYAVGKLINIVTASPDRVQSDCPVSETCGGCCYRHISYEAELKIKQQKVADAFSRIGHLDVKLDRIIGSKINGYRNKAQYPVGIGKPEPVIGFYAFNSHRIIPCRHCLLQPAMFEDILNIIDKWIRKNRITIFDEETGTGLLRHVYIRQAHATGEIMVCLVINGDSIPKCNELVNALLTGSDAIKTVLLNINKENTNVILGDKCKMLYGDGYIEDVLLGKRFRISPLSFYQVNSEQCEKLYSKAAEFANLTGDEFVLDLYCGAGTIGLTMADRIRKLMGVEIIPQAVEDAKYNASLNGISNAEFFCGDAAAVAEKLKNDGIRPDVIFIDPPRKGMDDGLVETVVSMAPEKLVYISCDPATLARDAALFAENGYVVKKAVPVDLFPRTAHVEACCLLVKTSDSAV